VDTAGSKLGHNVLQSEIAAHAVPKKDHTKQSNKSTSNENQYRHHQLSNQNQIPKPESDFKSRTSSNCKPNIKPKLKPITNHDQNHQSTSP
jgi:hypothetical protein